MGEREFYEEYFSKMMVREPEAEKQIVRIERLRREIAALHSVRRGLFVGVGRGAELMTGRGSFVGFDLPFGQLSRLQQETSTNRYVCGDGRHLPFGNGLFDYVVCSEVIEHIAERSRVLSEIERVLKDDGAVILSTPNWWSLYGLGRKLYELVAGKEFHADDQPIDVWTTPPALIQELEHHFLILKVKGSWYWAPTGKGWFQILPSLFGRLFRLLRPIDFFLGETLPYFGHSLWIVGQPRRNGVIGTAEPSFSLLSLPFIRVLFYVWLASFSFYAFYEAGIVQLFRFYVQKLIS